MSETVVIVRLVSLDFLKRCWENKDVKNLMAPRWTVAEADISAETVYESVAQVAKGKNDAIVDYFWHFLGLARLATRDAGRPSDESWRAQLRSRGWPLPHRTYATIDHPEVVDVIRKASKNLDWSVLFDNLYRLVPHRESAPSPPAPIIVQRLPQKTTAQVQPRERAKTKSSSAATKVKVNKAISTGPTVRKASTALPAHAAKRSRATKHWNDD